VRNLQTIKQSEDAAVSTVPYDVFVDNKLLSFQQQQGTINATGWGTHICTLCRSQRMALSDKQPGNGMAAQSQKMAKYLLHNVIGHHSHQTNLMHIGLNDQ
jgi:hypothetical protein